MTSKINRAPLLYYIKFCASFQIHRWIQTGVTVRKRSIQIEIGDFLSRANLKFGRWHWKTLGHLFYTTLSFVYHFKANDEFKLELQSGNAQLWGKIGVFSHVTSKFDGWPRKTIWHLLYTTQALCILSKPWVNSNWSYSREIPKLGQNQRFFLAVWPWNLTGDLEKQ